MATLEQIFLAEAADKLAENLGRIDACVPKLPDGFLWARGLRRLQPSGLPKVWPRAATRRSAARVTLAGCFRPAG